MPALTVIIPAYNAADYISECLRSIFAQTWHDFEVLVIDDGSTDGTARIVANVPDPRLRLYTLEHQGKSAALNVGVDLAEGQWIANMDADDLACPLRFERQLSFMWSEGIDVCGTAMQRLGPAGDERDIVWVPTEDSEIKFFMRFGNPLVCGSVIARASALREVGGYAAQPVAADYALWVRLAEIGCRFANLPEPLYRYRIHERSLSATMAPEQRRLAEDVRQRAARNVSQRLSVAATARACVRYQLRYNQDLRSIALHLLRLQIKTATLEIRQHRWKQSVRTALAVTVGASTFVVQIVLWPTRRARRRAQLPGPGLAPAPR